MGEDNIAVSAKGLWNLDIWQSVPLTEALNQKNKIMVKLDRNKLEEMLLRNLDKVSEPAKCRVEMLLNGKYEKELLNKALEVDKNKKDTIMLSNCEEVIMPNNLVFMVSTLLPEKKVKCSWESENVHGISELVAGKLILNREYVKDVYGIDRETESSKSDKRFAVKYHRLYDIPASWVKGKEGSEKFVVSVPYPLGKNGFGKIYVPAQDVSFEKNDKVKIFLRGTTTDVYYRPENENVTSIDRMYNGDLVHLKNEMTKAYRQIRLQRRSLPEIDDKILDVASEFA